MKYSTKTRVRYAETDGMGVVYHANYIIWLEVGRTEYFRNLGMPYSKMEEEGMFFPATEVYCKYLRPARYDHIIVIEVEVEKFTAARVFFKYKIFDKLKGELLAEATTTHALVNREGKPINIKKLPVLNKILEEALK